MTLFATYAEGYRPPAITETLIDGFHPPPVSTGRFIPNPDLKPEVAHSIEGGINLRNDGLLRADDQFRAKLGVFRNRVDDYIEQVFEIFPIPGGYQYQNVAEATLEGVELEASYDAGFAFGTLSGQVMRGVDERPGGAGERCRPTASSRSSASAPSTGALEAGTKITAVGRQGRRRQLGLVGEPYQSSTSSPPGSSARTPAPTSCSANIFDRRYTPYPNGSPSPGFNAKVSLTTRFGG